MRGVILAGGTGTRLGKLTKVTNKHLLPVGHEPMIGHGIRKLVGSGIKDITLVTNPESVGDFARLLGSGEDFLCNITYRVQNKPGGIAEALGLVKAYCDTRLCAVLLGDNIFQSKIPRVIIDGMIAPNHACIVLKQVPDPSRYGVVEFDREMIVGIEEKPTHPKSEYAITGIYRYPSDIFDVIKSLKPSARGELEITDVNNYYLKNHRISYSMLDGYWTDAGTTESLQLANDLVYRQPPRFS